MVDQKPNSDEKSSSSFRWANITEQFENEFKLTFSTDKKAHFDNLPDEYKTVDGAKTKWCSLLLIDAIIYILKNDEFNRSSRRAFNQHIVLYHCILDELKIIHESAYNEIFAEKRVASSKSGGSSLTNSTILPREKADRYSHLTLLDLVYPWNSMDSLRISLVNDGPPSKAKNKYVTIVQMLTNHENISKYNHNLNVIIQLVISKVLFVFNNYKSPRHMEIKPGGAAHSRNNRVPASHAAAPIELSHITSSLSPDTGVYSDSDTIQILSLLQQSAGSAGISADNQDPNLYLPAHTTSVAPNAHVTLTSSSMSSPRVVKVSRIDSGNMLTGGQTSSKKSKTTAGVGVGIGGSGIGGGLLNDDMQQSFNFLMDTSAAQMQEYSDAEFGPSSSAASSSALHPNTSTSSNTTSSGGITSSQDAKEDEDYELLLFLRRPTSQLNVLSIAPPAAHPVSGADGDQHSVASTHSQVSTVDSAVGDYFTQLSSISKADEIDHNLNGSLPNGSNPAVETETPHRMSVDGEEGSGGASPQSARTIHSAKTHEAAASLMLVTTTSPRTPRFLLSAPSLIRGQTADVISEKMNSTSFMDREVEQQREKEEVERGGGDFSDYRTVKSPQNKSQDINNTSIAINELNSILNNNTNITHYITTNTNNNNNNTTQDSLMDVEQDSFSAADKTDCESMVESPPGTNSSECGSGNNSVIEMKTDIPNPLHSQNTQNNIENTQTMTHIGHSDVAKIQAQIAHNMSEDREQLQQQLQQQDEVKQHYRGRDEVEEAGSNVVRDILNMGTF